MMFLSWLSKGYKQTIYENKMCVLAPESKVDGNMNLFQWLISTLQPTLVPEKCSCSENTGDYLYVETDFEGFANWSKL